MNTERIKDILKKYKIGIIFLFLVLILIAMVIYFKSKKEFLSLTSDYNTGSDKGNIVVTPSDLTPLAGGNANKTDIIPLLQLFPNSSYYDFKNKVFNSVPTSLQVSSQYNSAHDFKNLLSSSPTSETLTTLKNNKYASKDGQAKSSITITFPNPTPLVGLIIINRFDNDEGRERLNGAYFYVTFDNNATPTPFVHFPTKDNSKMAELYTIKWNAAGTSRNVKKIEIQHLNQTLNLSRILFVKAGLGPVACNQAALNTVITNVAPTACKNNGPCDMAQILAAINEACK